MRRTFSRRLLLDVRRVCSSVGLLPRQEQHASSLRFVFLSLEVKKGTEIPKVCVPDEMQHLADLPCVAHVAMNICTCCSGFNASDFSITYFPKFKHLSLRN